MAAHEPQPEMADLLASVPMANRAVRTLEHGKTLVLHAPIRKRWWMGPPLSWLPGVQFRDEKRVALDPIGREVWEQINGRRTTEQIVEKFAKRHQVRFHDARALVMQFLQMLMRRQLIAVVGKRRTKA